MCNLISLLFKQPGRIPILKYLKCMLNLEQTVIDFPIASYFERGQDKIITDNLPGLMFMLLQIF
jgi:hypothetical protein